MEKEVLKSALIDHGGDWGKLLSRVVAPILKKGLNGRFKGIFVKPKNIVEVC